jgi:hypothetical protein
VSEERVPKIDTGGQGEVVGGGGGLLNGVEGVVGAVTSVEEHPSTTILHRETETIKFNSHRVITSKTLNNN